MIKTMKWFQSQPKNLGVIIDNRPDEAKAKDYEFREIVAMADPVFYEEKKPRQFPDMNQGRTSRCVAFTAAKIMGVCMWLRDNVFVAFSPLHIYQRRVNKGEEGMIGDDCWKICQQGVTLELLAPSEGVKSDKENDAVKIEQYKQDVGKIFAISNWITLPTKDIDKVASVIQRTGKPVMVWYSFTSKEWSKEVPTLSDELNNKTALHHSVTAVDFGTYKGQTGLWIEDSAWFGGLKRRFVTAGFYAKRNFYAAYPMAFKFDVPNVKPSFDGSVKSLQDILKYEGFFPTNVDSTGLWLSITDKAVVQFCQKYKLDNPNRLMTKQFISKLKQLYP